MTPPHDRPTVALVATLLTLALSGARGFAAGPAVHWPQFRGPEATATLDDARLPDRWSRTENVVWSTAVPGQGWSSPIVWGNRVFVTTAVTDRELKQPSAGIFGNGTVFQMLKEGRSPEEAMAFVTARDTEMPDEAGELRWLVLSLDAETGDVLWVREAHHGAPPGGRHRKNTYASETPVTDGERVYVYLGNIGLFAFSLDGEPLWQKRLEPRKIYLDFGTGSSPALDDERVYVLSDNDEESYLAAFDKRDGAELWRVVRSTGERHSAWSTPFVWHSGSGDQIVAPGAGMVTAYRPGDGHVLWLLRGFSAVSTPMPFAHRQLLVLSGGSVSEPIRPLAAVRASAAGDITPPDGERSAEHVAWLDPRGGTYIPTPVAYGGLIYTVYDKGFLATWDLATGERLSMQRIGRGGNAFSASPWAYDGKVFALSEEGTTFVFEAGPDPRLLHENELDELALATPALTPLGLFLRTETRLYRVAAPDARAP